MPFWSRSERRATTPLSVVLYTRADCPLCEEMKAELARAGLASRYALSEVDIDTDAELTERFGRSIPVLEIAGRIAFKGRLTAAAFREKLARSMGGSS